VLIGIDASRATGDRLTGTERYSRELIAALIRIAPQHHYHLYVRDQLPLPEGEGEGRGEGRDEGQVETVHVSAPRLWTHLGLARELAANPPDALFVPSHVLPAAFIQPGMGKGIRAVATIHDLGYRHFPQAHPAMQRSYLDLGTRFTAARADAVLADSCATLRDLVAFYGVPPHKVRVAYPGHIPLVEVSEGQIEAALTKFGLRPQQPYALHVGTLQPRKNLRRLIHAWAKADRSNDAQLVLAGGQGWGGEDLHAEIEALGMQASVKLLGYVSDEEKSALMHSARAFVFPSLYEGFGFPVLEAQSAGVPVACSNTSSLPEVAGDAALLFDPQDVNAMTDALNRVMRDQPLRVDLSVKGRRNVARFTWGACARIALAAIEMDSTSKVESM
jgi:glycosyltransferase involved in cell wall biosynthesis